MEDSKFLSIKLQGDTCYLKEVIVIQVEGNIISHGSYEPGYHQG